MSRGPVLITPNRAEHGPTVNLMVMLAMMEGYDPIVVSSDPDLAAAMAADSCFFWAIETGQPPDVYDRDVANCWRAWADHLPYPGATKRKESGPVAHWLERGRVACGPVVHAQASRHGVDDWEPPF